MTTPDLAAYITARLAEEEAAARAGRPDFPAEWRAEVPRA